MPKFVWWLTIIFGLGIGGCGKKSTKTSTPSPDPQISADTHKAPPGTASSPDPQISTDAHPTPPGTASKGGVFRAQIAWEPLPQVAAYTTAKVTLTDAAGAAVKSADGLTFVPFMPTMGHGTSMREQTIAPVADQVGVFKVDKVFFMMGGAWVVKVSATVDGKADEADVAVNI